MKRPWQRFWLVVLGCAPWGEAGALNHAAKQMGARPRVWERGITGDPESAIAIFDTGIDANHAGFSSAFFGQGTPKVVAWYDAFGGREGVPNDRHSPLGSGHGTHAAGIAAASGFGALDAQGRIVNTHASQTSLDGEYPEQTAFHVDAVGTIDVDVAYDSDAGALRSATLLFGNREMAFDGSADERRLSSESTVVARISNLVGTAGLRRIGALEASRIAWNRLRFEVRDPSQFGVYTLVTERKITSRGLGGGMRYEYVAHWPARIDGRGRDLDDGLPYYAGLAPTATLAVVQATGAYALMDSLASLGSALRDHRVVVASLSAASSSFREQPFLELLDQGILTMAAVGNEGPGKSIGKPAAFPFTVAVGGLSPSELLAWYPNSGTQMDLLAPGGSHLSGGGVISVHSGQGNFMSAWGFDVVPDDGLGMQGSSMATPAAAGAATLVIHALGGFRRYLNDDTYTLSGRRLTKREKALHVKRLLCMTATELNTKRELARTTFVSEGRDPLLNRGYDPDRDAAAQNYGKDPHEGYGRINVDAAVDATLFALRTGDAQQFNLVSSRAVWNDTSTSPLGIWSGTFAFEKARAPKAWARHIDFASENGPPALRHRIEVEPSASLDVDIHLYRPEMGPWGEPLLLARSTRPEPGAREVIDFSPKAAGRHYVVVKAISGEGEVRIRFSELP